MNNLQWFVNNREVIKSIAVNTGTTGTPSYTDLCIASDIKFNTDLEVKDFDVFCDAIKRSIITGAKITIECDVKIDMNNEGVTGLLAKVHTLLTNGTVAQFNNELAQIELIEDVASNALTYKKYTVPVALKFSDLGGGATDEGSFKLEMQVNGKGTVVTNG